MGYFVRNDRTGEEVSVPPAGMGEWLRRIQTEKGYWTLDHTDVICRHENGEFMWRAPFLLIHLLTGTQHRLKEWPK